MIATNINRPPHKGDHVTDSTAVATYDSQLLTAAQAAGVDLRAMLALVPEADDDAMVAIIVQIVNAQSPEQLDAPWSATGMERLDGQWISVRALKRMPSEYADGLGFYLIVDARIVETGEIVSVSTGSVSIIVQLLRANALGAFPLTVKPVIAAKPSANGFRPMHLEIARG